MEWTSGTALIQVRAKKWWYWFDPRFWRFVRHTVLTNSWLRYNGAVVQEDKAEFWTTKLGIRFDDRESAHSDEGSPNE